MSERKYYCFCESNCKFETMTKEQILAAIAQATGVTNVDPNAGFISKVKEMNGGYVTFWLGTQAQFNALAEKAANCLYIITDSKNEIELAIFKKELEEACADAITIAERAKKQAADADAKADQALAVRMVREFYTGVMAETYVYTTPGSMSKLYHVTLMDEATGAQYAIMLDWRTIYDQGGLMYVVTTDPVTRLLGAEVNADNTVTFSSVYLLIVNVSGYY